MLLIAHRITLSFCEPSNQKDSVSQRILPLLEKNSVLPCTASNSKNSDIHNHYIYKKHY